MTTLRQSPGFVTSDLQSYMSDYGYGLFSCDDVAHWHAFARRDSMTHSIMQLKMNLMLRNRISFIGHVEREYEQTRSPKRRRFAGLSRVPENGPSEINNSDVLTESWRAQLREILFSAWSTGIGASITAREARRLRALEAIVLSADSPAEAWNAIHSHSKSEQRLQRAQKAFQRCHAIDDGNWERGMADVGQELPDDDNVWFDSTRTPQSEPDNEEDDLRVEAVHLDRCLVFYKRGATGCIRFLYWLPIMCAKQTVFLRIRNVFTFIDSRPGDDGRVVSRVTRAQPEFQLEETNRLAYSKAVQVMAFPYVPLLRPELKQGYDDDDQDLALSRYTEASMPVPRDDPPPKNSLEALRRYDNLNEFPAPERRARAAAGAPPTFPFNAVDLPPGWTVAKAPDSHAPPSFVDCFQLRRSRLFQEFDMPEGVIGMYSLQESKDFSSIGGLGGKTMSTESLPWRLLNDSTEQLTIGVCEYVNAILGYSTNERRIRLAAKEAISNVEQGKPAAGLDPDKHAIKMTMVRKQESEQVIPLMTAGIMKWDAGLLMLAERMGVDPSVFHAQPQLTLEQLAGVQSEEPSPGEK